MQKTGVQIVHHLPRSKKPWSRSSFLLIASLISITCGLMAASLLMKPEFFTLQKDQAFQASTKTVSRADPSAISAPDVVPEPVASQKRIKCSRPCKNNKHKNRKSRKQRPCKRNGCKRVKGQEEQVLEKAWAREAGHVEEPALGCQGRKHGCSRPGQLGRTSQKLIHRKKASKKTSKKGIEKTEKSWRRCRKAPQCAGHRDRR
jgi:hypothetical protein